MVCTGVELSRELRRGNTDTVRHRIQGGELGGGNAFYRHFDVTELPPLPKSFPAQCVLVDDAPAWVELDWSRLYYQHSLGRESGSSRYDAYF